MVGPARPDILLPAYWAVQVIKMGSASSPPSRRTEVRSPLRVYVELSNPDTGALGISPAFNVSPHGLKVITKRRWLPSHPVSVRTIQGDFLSRARVVYSEPAPDNSFAIGLELYLPVTDWTVFATPPRRRIEDPRD